MKLLTSSDKRRAQRQWLTAHVYILPLLVVVLGILVYPILSSLFLSFQDTKIPINGIPFVLTSLQNYVRMFGSADFYQALLNTFVIASIASVFCIVFGTATALAVHGVHHRFGLLKSLAVLPWAIPSVTAAVTWGWMFDGSFGLVNWILVKAGILQQGIVWNQDPAGALVIVILLLIWKGYPFITIMVLAGLQSVSDELYEAAGLEGASAWNKLVSITLPLLRPVLAVCGLLTGLWVFRDYPIVYLLTGGGPIGRTRTLALMTYQQAFESFNMSYGAAVGAITLLICFLFAYFIITQQNKESV